LLPTAVIEIANTSVNTSWYLLFAVFWALLWRYRSRAGMVVAAIVGAAAMSSQGLAVFYAPLVAMRMIALPRLREQAATAGWLAGLALQAGVILGSGLPPARGSLPAALNYQFHHVVVAAATGWHLALRLHAESGGGPAVVIAGCAVAAMAGWAIVRGDARLRLFAADTMTLGIVLTVIPALSRPWVTTSPVTTQWLPGSRYTATPILLITSLAIVVADTWLLRSGAARWRIVHWAGAAIIVIVLATTWVNDFRYVNVRTAGPDWPQTVSRFDHACRQRPSSAVEPLFYWEAKQNELPLPCWVAHRPTRASHQTRDLVNTGVAATRVADEAVAVIGHLRGRAETRGWVRLGPSDGHSVHREPTGLIRQGHYQLSPRPQGVSLTGPEGLLKQLTKTVLETALNQQMTEHLGHDKHGPVTSETGNVPNGTRPKTVLTEASGQVGIEVPPRLAGTFEPQIVRTGCPGGTRARPSNGKDCAGFRGFAAATGGG
jgi:hypothetical protein